MSSTLFKYTAPGDSRTYYVIKYDAGVVRVAAKPMFEWCTETFGPVGDGWKSNRWAFEAHRGAVRVSFRSKDDAMLFYLRWHTPE